MIRYKPEIDSLRAIAVFLVVFFHIELLNFQGGFIGVDIFFVISGYLITNIIINDCENKKFSFFDFYIRRIRRIIPALYATIFITLIFAFFIFSADHFERLTKSTVYSTSAISNFFFWGEYGYFDFNKHFKPLLHTWSLSVEIQFYLIWPLLLWISFRFLKKYISLIVFFVFLITLILSILYSHRSDGFFYFTIFRFYEFAIGAFIYLYKDKLIKKNNDVFFLIGITLILSSSFIYSQQSTFPGFNALIPCLGAAIILSSSDNLKLFKNILINKYLIFLGKISYSIYLVHWPLLIFYKYAVLHPLNFIEKLLIIILTIVISFLSYKFIELPFRKKTKNTFSISTQKIMVIFIVSFISIIFISNSLNKDLEKSNLDLRKEIILDKMKISKKIILEIEKEAMAKIVNKAFFKDNNKPVKVVVFGDSHGLDFYSSLKSNNNFSSLDLEFLMYRYFYCFNKVNFADKIVQIIKSKIISFHSCSNKINEFKYYDILKKADVIILSSRWNDKVNFYELKKFINKFSSQKIIVIGRKPFFYDVPTLFSRSDTNLNKLAFLNQDKKTKIINDKIKSQIVKNNLIFFDLENLICQNQICFVSTEDHLLLTDEDHWSYEGAIFYGKKLIENGFLKIIIAK